jgi:hypothetical protein
VTTTATQEGREARIMSAMDGSVATPDRLLGLGTERGATRSPARSGSADA